MTRSIPKILVIVNDEGSGPGHLLPWLEHVGVRPVVVNGSAGLPDELTGFDGLLMLGGGFLPDADDRAPWLPQERKLAAAAIADDVPTLGICLGGQLLAHTAGGEVRGNDGEPEYGMVEVRTTRSGANDPVLSTLDGRAHLVEHHRDRITELPAGAVLLASSRSCRVQAFRLGQNVRGLQFHPEASYDEVASWDKDRLQEDGFDPDEMVSEAQQWNAECERTGRALTEAFAAQVRDVAASSTGIAQVGTATPMRTSGIPLEVANALRHTVGTRQAAWRVPGLYGAISRHGALVWGEGVGAGDLDRPAEPPSSDLQYLIASNTKTFTAVAVMALRDEGKLSLDDPIDKHLPGVTHRGITIREMLAHVSGMQREPVGDVWEVESADLIANFNQAERVLRPHYRWHYSNLVYAVLGDLVARLDSRPWYESIRERILLPLEMHRTSVGLSGNSAKGYSVPRYTDVPVEEHVGDLKAMAACGGLASTADDLAKWQGFVADPVPEVLSPDTVEEMVQPQAMADLDQWTQAHGLGFSLRRVRGRVFVGHTGGLPGHASGIFINRETGTGGIALMNSSAGNDPAGLATELAAYVIDSVPEPPRAWRPGKRVPEEFLEILGGWFSEGECHIFSVREGRLEARLEGESAGAAPSTFVKVGEDVYRTVSGREVGELLTLDRGADRSVPTMHWATYQFTREP